MQKPYYQQLLIFHRIVETGSISAAARQLEMSVPAVSKALSHLEKAIGLVLFQRTTRKLVLTEAGQYLLDQTKSAIDKIELSVQQIQDHLNQPSGNVKMTLSQLAYYLIWEPLCVEFCQSFPQVQIELSIHNATVDIVSEQFDLGIRFGHSLEEGMVAHSLTAPMREGLFVSKQYAQKWGVPRSIEDLQHHRLIGHRFMTNNKINPLSLQVGDDVRTMASMQTPLVLNDTEALIHATRQGLGIGRIFDQRYEQLADKDEFIPVLEAYWVSFPALYVYYFPRQQQLKKVKAVIDFLLSHRQI